MLNQESGITDHADVEDFQFWFRPAFTKYLAENFHGLKSIGKNIILRVRQIILFPGELEFLHLIQNLE